MHAHGIHCYKLFIVNQRGVHASGVRAARRRASIRLSRSRIAPVRHTHHWLRLSNSFLLRNIDRALRQGPAFS